MQQEEQSLGKPYNPLIIAHRGYCSLFPENTLESIEAALTKTHLVQFDILLTKDEQVVIFHDRYLSKVTDVQAFSEFQTRKASYQDYSKDGRTLISDWWLKDFNLEDLKKLSVSQRSKKRPLLKNLTFRIPTLLQTFQQILQAKQNRMTGNKTGFLIEIKGYQQYQSSHQDKIIVEKLVQILKKVGLDTKAKCESKNFPVVIQSFNKDVMRYCIESQLDIPFVHLFDKDKEITKEFLRLELSEKSIGIAISEKHANQNVISICKELNLSVYFWTLIDDQPQKLPSTIPSFKHAYLFLFSLGIDGIITEFPQNCIQYLNQFRRK